MLPSYCSVDTAYLDRLLCIRTHIGFVFSARRGMPAEPTIPDDVRSAWRTELRHFAHLPLPEFDRWRTVVASTDAAGGAEHVADRVCMEDLSVARFQQRWYSLLGTRPRVQTKYLPFDDALVVACREHVPLSKHKRRTFTPTVCVCVCCFAPWCVRSSIAFLCIRSLSLSSCTASTHFCTFYIHI